MCKLAVFDVDGTLVSRGKRVLLESTVASLHALKAKGIKIAIASGRPAFAMEQSLLDVVDFDYFICSNGTFVTDENRHELFKEEMSREIVEAITLDFIKNDDALLFQFEDNAYIYHGKKRISSMINQCLGRLDILVDDREYTSRHLKSLPYAGVSWIAKHNVDYYQRRYPKYRFEEFMEDHYDIYPLHCSKATGIMHLCDSIGITMEDVICFGDALNDVEMLKSCGCGVAMGDALEEAKAVADYITTPSDEDGIFNACKHLKLIKEKR